MIFWMSDDKNGASTYTYSFANPAFSPSNPISKALNKGLKLNLEVQHCKENLLQYTVDDILDE